MDTEVKAVGNTPEIGENTGHRAVGDDGQDGLTPVIGEDGNWWIGDLNTMVKAAGQEGLTPHIGENGNWWLGDNDTGHRAIGLDGKDGADGVTPRLKIGGDGLWYVSYDNGDSWESLNVQAVGVKSEKGDKDDQGDQGEKGDQGIQGIQGAQGIQGVKGDKGDTGATGATGARGAKGDKGDQDEAGEDGKDGTVAAGIDGAQINEEGDLILTLADGTTINAGRVRDDQDNSEPENTESTPPAIGASTVVAICLAGASLLGIGITLMILLIRKRGR